MQETFKDYLESLRTTVKRTPTSDAERGFQVAVVLIYEKYNKLK